jgi:hypothetical protein
VRAARSQSALCYAMPSSTALARATLVSGAACVPGAGIADAIGDAYLQHLADQAMNHGVPATVHLDMVVEVGPAALPLSVFEGFRSHFGCAWRERRM